MFRCHMCGRELIDVNIVKIELEKACGRAAIIAVKVSGYCPECREVTETYVYKALEV